MSEPTKAQLIEMLDAAEAEADDLDRKLANIDQEAWVYHQCYQALSKLKTSDGRSYATSTKSPDRAAIRRVINAISERFDLDFDKTESTLAQNFYNEPMLESQDDPRDEIIKMLIDAMRKL